MELCSEKNYPEEHGQNANALCLAKHVLTKMELRMEWLRGQGSIDGDVHCMDKGGCETSQTDGPSHEIISD